MDNYGNNGAPSFMSDEVAAAISQNWVFSIGPKYEASSASDPYKMMNQDSSAMQLRIMPYNKANDNKGGTRVVFNISLPMYDTLVKAVDAALLGQVTDFDLGAVWQNSDYGELQRIFGNPDPTTGRCPARCISIKRQPVMPDGTRAKLPWVIVIKNGTGIKVMNRNGGGAYMQPKSFQPNPDGTCIARMTDGQMKETLYWGVKLTDIMFSATKDGVVAGHKCIEQRRAEYKKQSFASRASSQNGQQNGGYQRNSGYAAPASNGGYQANPGNTGYQSTPANQQGQYRQNNGGYNNGYPGY